MLVESLYGAARGLKSVSGSFDALSKTPSVKLKGFSQAPIRAYFDPRKPRRASDPLRRQGVTRKKQYPGSSTQSTKARRPRQAQCVHPMIAQNFFSFSPSVAAVLAGCCVAASGTRRRGAPTARGDGSGLRSSRRRAVYTPLKGGYTPATGFCGPATRITPWRNRGEIEKSQGFR